MMEQELVEYIAQNLVNDPSQVSVRSRKTGSSVILELRVGQGDMGRVIGKQGRVANAIRSLLRVIGTRNNTRIVLDID
jgi:uncharacterized protein